MKCCTFLLCDSRTDDDREIRRNNSRHDPRFRLISYSGVNHLSLTHDDCITHLKPHTMPVPASIHKPQTMFQINVAVVVVFWTATCVAAHANETGVESPSKLGDSCVQESECQAFDRQSTCLGNTCQCQRWSSPTSSGCSNFLWIVVWFGAGFLFLVFLGILSSVIFVCIKGSRKESEAGASLTANAAAAAASQATSDRSAIELQQMFTEATHYASVDVASGEAVAIRVNSGGLLV